MEPKDPPPPPYPITEDELSPEMRSKTLSPRRGVRGPAPKWEWRWLTTGDKLIFEPESEAHRRYVKHKLRGYARDRALTLEWWPLTGTEREKFAEKQANAGVDKPVTPVRVQLVEDEGQLQPDVWTRFADGQALRARRQSRLIGTMEGAGLKARDRVKEALLASA